MVLLLAAALMLPAKTGFAYGRTGGNIIPFTVTIATSGAVKTTGAISDHAAMLTKPQLADLDRVAYDVSFSTIPAVTTCPSTLPDVAAQWIRVGSRTVRVHGGCAKRFNRLWTALNRAVARP